MSDPHYIHFGPTLHLLSHQPLVVKTSNFIGYQSLRKFKVSKISFVWLPWQLFNDIVLFRIIVETYLKKQLIFKYFQKPQISSCQNKSLFGDSSILVLFIKVIYKWMRVPDFWEGEWKIGLNLEKFLFP